MFIAFIVTGILFVCAMIYQIIYYKRYGTPHVILSALNPFLGFLFGMTIYMNFIQ